MLEVILLLRNVKAAVLGQQLTSALDYLIIDATTQDLIAEDDFSIFPKVD